MSHVNEALLLLPLLLPCTSTSPAQTVTEVPTHKGAKELRNSCRGYIATIDGTIQTVRNQINAGICLGYIQGAVDGFYLAMVTWEVPTSAKACVPKEATTEDLVRVFLKYIDGHPEHLSDSAVSAVWQAMVASYPCPAK
jgi:hypothetical protein